MPEDEKEAKLPSVSATPLYFCYVTAVAVCGGREPGTTAGVSEESCLISACRINGQDTQTPPGYRRFLSKDAVTFRASSP